MKRRLFLAGSGAALLAGCTTAQPLPSVTPRPADPSSIDAPTAAATATPESSPASTPSKAAAATTPGGNDNRSGNALGQPFVVSGLIVVSKAHRVSAAYVPDWSRLPNGLHADVSAAFARLTKAAKADGLTMSIRSAYRSFAAQKASFDGAMKRYPEAVARRYYAEPGASEHQTGLALDAWDGKNRGTAFARTPHASWLAKHAHEHGFIIRYPDGKTHITGYAWESWHLRWVGTDVAAKFGPNSTLTLEEYLGLA